MSQPYQQALNGCTTGCGQWFALMVLFMGGFFLIGWINSCVEIVPLYDSREKEKLAEPQAIQPKPILIAPEKPEEPIIIKEPPCLEALEVGSEYYVINSAVFSTVKGANDRPLFQGAHFRVVEKVSEEDNTPWYKVNFRDKILWLEGSKSQLMNILNDETKTKQELFQKEQELIKEAQQNKADAQKIKEHEATSQKYSSPHPRPGEYTRRRLQEVEEVKRWFERGQYGLY